jgi:hypothetical protein
MSLSDPADDELDLNYRQIYVLINANDQPQTFTVPGGQGMKLALHPVQRASVDPLVRTARFNISSGAFTIPGRTVAVFVAYDPSGLRMLRLIGDVQALVNADVLNRGQGNSLNAKLLAAIAAVKKGNVKAATSQLAAFVNQVQAYQRAGILTPEQAQPLIDTALDIIYQIQHAL